MNRVKIAVLKFVDLVGENVCGGLPFELRWRTCAFIVTKSGHCHGYFPSFFLSDFNTSSGKSFFLLLFPLKPQKIIRNFVKWRLKFGKMSVYHLYLKIGSSADSFATLLKLLGQLFIFLAVNSNKFLPFFKYSVFVYSCQIFDRPCYFNIINVQLTLLNMINIALPSTRFFQKLRRRTGI